MIRQVRGPREHVGEPGEVERAVGDEPARDHRRRRATRRTPRGTPAAPRPPAPRTRTTRDPVPTPTAERGVGTGERRAGHRGQPITVSVHSGSTPRGSRRCPPGRPSNGSVGERRRTPPTPRAARRSGSPGTCTCDPGMSAWTSSDSRKSSSCCAPVGFGRAGQHARVLDLPEAGVEQRAGGRLVAALGHGERRRGRVGQDDRPRAVAAAAGEVGVVGVGPAVGDLARRCPAAPSSSPASRPRRTRRRSRAGRRARATTSPRWARRAGPCTRAR